MSRTTTSGLPVAAAFLTSTLALCLGASDLAVGAAVLGYAAALLDAAG